MSREIPQTNSNLGSTLTGVANLANLFLGSSQAQTGQTTGSTTGGTTDSRGSTTVNSGGTTVVTDQTQAAPGAVDAVIRSILEGTNGLAAVSSGQRQAGLYNSSTNTLLSNDLAARAAGEAAKLNTTRTQTTVAPSTSQTTQNSGGTTTTQNQTQNQNTNTVKPAAISGGIAGGAGAALAALQLIPKDVKDSIISGLGLGKKSGSSVSGSVPDVSSSDRADVIKMFGGDEAAQDVAAVGVDGLGSSFSGIGTDQFGDFSQAVEYSGAASDVAGVGDFSDVGGYDLTIDSGGDAAAGIADSAGSFFDGAGDALGGLLAGIGESAGGFFDGIGSFFDDFDFSFADGGVVSKSDLQTRMAEHLKVKLADGGGIGAAGDTRYGNSGRASAGKPMAQQAIQENLFERTRRTGAEQAGLQAQPEVMQRGFIPRNEVERQSVFSLINTIPQLIGALIGTDQTAAAPQGKADGGAVSTNPKAYADGGSVTDAPIKREHFANGGVAQARAGNVYDLGDISYLANTGLRPTGASLVDTVGAESNDSIITGMIRDNMRAPASASATATASKGATAANTIRTNPDDVRFQQLFDKGNQLGKYARSATSSAGANSGAGPDGSLEAAGAGVSVGSGIGSVSGIASAIGTSPAVGQAGLSAALGLSGLSVPGLAGLANAPNNQAAVNAFISTVVGLANPALGIAASIALNALSNSNNTSSNAGNDGNASDDGPEGSVTVGPIGTVTAMSAEDAEADANANAAANAGGNGNGDGAASAGNAGTGSAGDDGSGDGAGPGGGGGAGSGAGPGFADGGVMAQVNAVRDNPNTTADKIPAMLSEGEYVLPADMAAAIGIPFLDQLKAKLHQPAAKQKAMH